MSSSVLTKTLSTAGTLGVTTTAAAPVVIPVGPATVLTVGAGMEFSTLGEALRAASNGDTIAVKAGTYTNDFGTVSANVSIVAVGGLVNEVATEPPPDDKGILTVSANLNIKGFTFTGGSDGSPDGNVCGIRLQGGNLNVSYCSFSDMQEGLLADADPTASITIDHSTFLDNGTGDGLTHNLYVSSVKSLVVTNSLFMGAVVGHEIKSRAMSTTIENNVIADGPTGTASYDIDIPNAGVAVVSGNIIEKGPDASNTYAIHYGGETQYSYTQNSLSITNNTIINDMPSNVVSTLLLNQSSVNLSNAVTATLQGNSLYHYSAANIAIGPVKTSGNTNLTTEPTYNTISPLTLLPTITLGTGPETLNLVTGNHTVSGGASLLTLTDTCGSNTINGGAGGLNVAAPAGWDQITTSASGSDTINTSGRNCTVFSNGTDHINASSYYETIEATGHATITGGGFNTYDLNGAGEVLTTSASGNLNIGAAGNATVTDDSGDLCYTLASGGHLVAADHADTVNGVAQATISGGAATGWISSAGTVSVTTGSAGTRIQGGTGLVSVTGGAGNDTIIAGSGTLDASLGGGQDSVTFGSGNASVAGGAGADHFVFTKGNDGHDTITGYTQGRDSLVFDNFTGTAIASGSITNGSTLLTLADGTTIFLAGVALPGYNSTSPTTPSAPTTATSGGGTSSTPTSGSNSSGTLTTGGHSVAGGATLLTEADVAGNNTIAGGAGGLTVAAADNDTLSTKAGSTNQVTLTRYDTLTGAGADHVVATAYCNTITEQGAATIALNGTVNTVQGGAGLLTVSDTTGSNKITGGAGGLNTSLSGGYDQVTTQAGATDTIGLGAYSSLLSQGNDHISVNGVYDTVTVTGAAAITAGAVYSGFVLNGIDTLTDAGSFAATVGGAATAVLACTGTDCGVSKLAGGNVALSQVLSTGGTASITVSGGAATLVSSEVSYPGIYVTVGGGTYVTSGTGQETVTSAAASGAASDTIHAGSGLLTINAGAVGVNVVAGSGNVTLNGGTGADVFAGGAGRAVLNLGGGADTITFGNGATTVNGGANDTFVVPVGDTGTAVITNWSAGDHFAASGGSEAALASATVSGGNYVMSFAGGAQIELVGVTHLT